MECATIVAIECANQLDSAVEQPSGSRTFTVEGRRTSVWLEPVLWDALTHIAKVRGQDLHELLADIEGKRTAGNLTSAIRVYVVEFYRNFRNGGDESLFARPRGKRGRSMRQRAH